MKTYPNKIVSFAPIFIQSNEKIYNRYIDGDHACRIRYGPRQRHFNSKDGQTAVGNTFNTDTAKQDSTPALSKRELRRQRVARRNLHYNILGGPSYTPDFGLLIGGSALMTFRMNRATPPNNAPWYL